MTDIKALRDGRVPKGWPVSHMELNLPAFTCSECGWHHAVDCQDKAALAALRERTLNVARGCADYGGGHHNDGKMDAFQHGIQTVVRALTEFFDDKPNDHQVAALERIGRERAAKEGA